MIVGETTAGRETVAGNWDDRKKAGECQRVT
jgi:hypothetical protein